MVALGIFKQGIVQLVKVLRCVYLLEQVTSSARVVHVPVDHSAMITMRGIRQLDGAALILIEMCPCGIQIVILCSWHPLAAPSGLLRFPPKARSKIKITFALCCLASGSL